MTKPLPFFSVVITTYNRAALVCRALESLVKQTEPDWEAIIVDDGSTDATHAAIASFLKQNQKFIYYFQQNQGAVAAKNKGISKATGRYITFLDSDDEFAPFHLAHRKQLLLKNPSAGFLHGGAKIIGNSFVPDRFNPKQLIHLDDCAIGATFFLTKALIKQLNGFREMPLGSDADFLERAIAAKVTILKTTEPTYIYHRESGDSVTNNFLNK